MEKTNNLKIRKENLQKSLDRQIAGLPLDEQLSLLRWAEDQARDKRTDLLAKEIRKYTQKG